MHVQSWESIVLAAGRAVPRAGVMKEEGRGSICVIWACN